MKRFMGEFDDVSLEGYIAAKKLKVQELSLKLKLQQTKLAILQAKVAMR